MPRPLNGAVRAWWRSLAKRAARTYVAGPGLADALQVCRRLDRRGVAGTIGFWNGDGDRPRAVADAYLAGSIAVSVERLKCALAVKAPALGFDSDLLAAVLEQCRRNGVRVHFDSLEPEAADRTCAVIEQALPHGPGLGCTIPGRWRRSLRDVEWAIEMGLHVRVVKGQWADPDDPAVDPGSGFLAVVERLAGRACSVSVATHDPALARDALRRLRSARTPCELELLWRLPAQPVVRVASEARVPVRVYVPYGSAWLPYRLSQASRNPRVLWWFVRDLAAARPLVSA